MRRAFVLCAAVVLLGACTAGEAVTETGGLAVDGGCPGTPIPCCIGGRNGDAVTGSYCNPWRRWECPVGTVGPDDCDLTGVRWCSGGPLPDAG